MLTRWIGRILRHPGETALWLRQLGTALLSQRRIVSTTGYGTVTCTTFPARQWAALVALDSISRGEILPARVALFLDKPTYGQGRLPFPIRRLAKRGVEVILLDQDDGSYKKLPVFTWGFEDTPMPVVSVDDDTVYPPAWLAGFKQAALESPLCVLCYRGRRMRIAPQGDPAPYAEWDLVRHALARRWSLPTGVGGILYPRPALEAIRDRGTGFRTQARNVDDLWFRLCTLEAGLLVRQVRPSPANFRAIAFTGETALYPANAAGGGNDQAMQQFRQLFNLGFPAEAGDEEGDPTTSVDTARTGEGRPHD